MIVLFIGSCQLLVAGLMGEYLGRLYVESKRRPLFVVQDIVRLPQAVGAGADKAAAARIAAATTGAAMTGADKAGADKAASDRVGSGRADSGRGQGVAEAERLSN
jgi:hypothetical protein